MKSEDLIGLPNRLYQKFRTKWLNSYAVTVNPEEGYVVKDDYSEELAATLDYVKGQLESHGVESQLPADLE